jgi:hypothetical protein
MGLYEMWGIGGDRMYGGGRSERRETERGDGATEGGRVAHIPRPGLLTAHATADSGVITFLKIIT